MRIRALQQLRDRTVFLMKRGEEIISKIDRSGISSNYSVSSDVMRIAEDIYRLELRLGELGLIVYDIEHGNKK